MNSTLRFLVASTVVAGLALIGCAPSPAPPPTQPAVAATKVAEPAKALPAPTQAAAVPQPTAAPAKTLEYPAKGKAITMIVAYAPGGGGDALARVTSVLLGKELGTAVEVVNKPGASGQLGFTELVGSKPDGYTLAAMTNLPTILPTYLDPERKAIYSRKDFQPLAVQAYQTYTLAVQKDSPFKTLSDVIAAAKSSPGKITVGANGLLTASHVGVVRLEKAADVKFAQVQFDGAGPTMTALLGGHVQIAAMGVAEMLPPVKAGTARVLAIFGREEHRNYPGVKTVEEQGYKAYVDNLIGMSAPAGMPKEIVNVLSGAMKKVVDSQEYKTKAAELGFDTRYMGPEEFAATWADMEAEVKLLIDQARK